MSHNQYSLVVTLPYDNTLAILVMIKAAPTLALGLVLDSPNAALCEFHGMTSLRHELIVVDIAPFLVIMGEFCGFAWGSAKNCPVQSM